MESKHLCTVGGTHERWQDLSYEIHKAKTQNPRAWADKIGIHSLVKLVWQASRGASGALFNTRSEVPSLESLLHRSPCYILQGKRHLFWYLMYLLVFFSPIPSYFPGDSLSVCQESQEHPSEEEGKSLPGARANSWRSHPEGDEKWMSAREVSWVHQEARRGESRAYHLMQLSWVTGEVAQWSQGTWDSDPYEQCSCGR